MRSFVALISNVCVKLVLRWAAWRCLVEGFPAALTPKSHLGWVLCCWWREKWVWVLQHLPLCLLTLPLSPHPLPLFPLSFPFTPTHFFCSSFQQTFSALSLVFCGNVIVQEVYILTLMNMCRLKERGLWLKFSHVATLTSLCTSCWFIPLITHPTRHIRRDSYTFLRHILPDFYKESRPHFSDAFSLSLLSPFILLKAQVLLKGSVEHSHDVPLRLGLEATNDYQKSTELFLKPAVEMWGSYLCSHMPDIHPTFSLAPCFSCLLVTGSVIPVVFEGFIQSSSTLIRKPVRFHSACPV